jgi:hypothetical protein
VSARACTNHKKMAQKVCTQVPEQEPLLKGQPLFADARPSVTYIKGVVHKELLAEKPIQLPPYHPEVALMRIREREEADKIEMDRIMAEIERKNAIHRQAVETCLRAYWSKVFTTLRSRNFPISLKDVQKEFKHDKRHPDKVRLDVNREMTMEEFREWSTKIIAEYNSSSPRIKYKLSYCRDYGDFELRVVEEPEPKKSSVSCCIC